MPTAPPPDDRYHRQSLLAPIGAAGQGKLSRARVLIVGCGALGTCSAEYLARAGVGALRLVDRDLVEWSNLARQIAFTETDARDARPKAVALGEHLTRVRSDLDLDVQPTELDAANARELADGVDVIVDGTDNIPTRFLINDLAYAGGIPWVYAGAIETRGHCLAIPGVGGPCLRCYLDEPPPPGTLATCDTAGVLGPAVGAIASWQAALTIRALVDGAAAPGLAGRLVQLDPWRLDCRVATVEPDPECPVCVGGRFDWLDAAAVSRGAATGSVGSGSAAKLCGRRAVQVRPAAPDGGRPRVDLDRIAARLEPIGRVESLPYCVRLHRDEITMTLFPDGRAIFDGLTDTARARSLYARFVGE